MREERRKEEGRDSQRKGFGEKIDRTVVVVVVVEESEEKQKGERQNS